LVLSRFNIGIFHIPIGTSNAAGLLGVLMPAITALVLTARGGGFKEVRNLLRPLKTWRVGWRWWAAAVLVWPVLLVLTGLIYNWLWHDPPISAVPFSSIASFLVNIFFLLVATLGEEIGWRGLALPALERRSSALRASVILGVVWATWHVPYWLLQDTFTQYGFVYLVLSFLFVLPGAFYITWFYNHGRFSLLLPVAFHITFNIVNVAWLPVTSSMGAFGILIALEWVLALILVRHLEPSVQIKSNSV
jgi:uncharacterized protein